MLVGRLLGPVIGALLGLLNLGNQGSIVTACGRQSRVCEVYADQNTQIFR